MTTCQPVPWQQARSVCKVLLAASLLFVQCLGSAHAQIQPYSLNPSYWQYDGHPLIVIWWFQSGQCFSVDG